MNDPELERLWKQDNNWRPLQDVLRDRISFLESQTLQRGLTLADDEVREICQIIGLGVERMGVWN